ncbi:MAG: glutathione peroxidase [Alphaproteobacteria bacterium]
MTMAYDFMFDALHGVPLPLSAWQGRPILIVNTASQCGFTKQYAALQQLWLNYRGRGLMVLGVPCNDFGKQEPGDAKTIDEFCTRNFGVDFPLTAKYHVLGRQAHPFYQWANTWAGFIGSPKWNFHKYLIGPQGQLIDWYSSITPPDSPGITGMIEYLLTMEKTS